MGVLASAASRYPPDLPVVMISAKAAVADKVEGVEHFCELSEIPVPSGMLSRGRQ